MSYFFLIVLILINLYWLVKILLGKVSILHPFSVFVLTVVCQMLPQLFVIFVHPSYNKEIIPLLLFVMIISQLAFWGGTYIVKFWYPSSSCIDFSEKRIFFLICLFSVVSIFPMFCYDSMESVQGGINVVLGFFRNLGVLSAILLLKLLLSDNHTHSRKKLYFFCMISVLPLCYYAFCVKGSRETSFLLFFLFFSFFLLQYPSYKRILSVLFVVIFVLGSLLGSSTGEIRRNKNESLEDILDINFIDNFKHSMLNPNLFHGMDLGNGALLIDYVYENNLYDYGAFVWNGFVYNYFPQRLIGKSNKESYYISPATGTLKHLEEKITNGVTTVTGYYVSFKSFSFFGCILFFFLIGAFLECVKKLANYSSFYFMVYFFGVLKVPLVITHSFQYFFSAMEFLFIILFPFLLFFIKRKKSIS